MIAIFPEIVQCAAVGDVERLAILFRKYYGGPAAASPQPSIVALLAAAGLGLSEIPGGPLGALLAKDERGAFRVVAVVGDRGGECERRFLLAHQLGHYLLDIQPLIASGDWQVSGFREAACPLQRYAAGGGAPLIDHDARREARADEFAAALLMPRGMVRRALEKLGDVEKVAAFFGVTRACLVRRLQDIGLQPALPVNFLDAERRLSPPSPAAASAPALLAPEGAMPRSYAASTYGATERATSARGVEDGEPAAPRRRPSPPRSAAPAGTPMRGAAPAGAPGRGAAPAGAPGRGAAPAGTPGRGAAPASTRAGRATSETNAGSAARGRDPDAGSGARAATPSAGERGRATNQERGAREPREPMASPASTPVGGEPAAGDRGRRPREEDPHSSSTQPPAPSEGRRGMERLREIARKLDKGVPKA